MGKRMSNAVLQAARKNGFSCDKVALLIQAEALLDALEVERVMVERLSARIIDRSITIMQQQVTIDALMLEHCPDEMTPEQVDEWGKNQRPIKEQPNGS